MSDEREKKREEKYFSTYVLLADNFFFKGVEKKERGKQSDEGKRLYF